ncbi:unnamed protein product [Amoebophrya sp. A120]|nr:unnamed protein product [Amoebophrya sp. A120]|eukprot:GSA120T00015536001.1
MDECEEYFRQVHDHEAHAQDAIQIHPDAGTMKRHTKGANGTDGGLGLAFSDCEVEDVDVIQQPEIKQSGDEEVKEVQKNNANGETTSKSLAGVVGSSSTTFDEEDDTTEVAVAHEIEDVDPLAKLAARAVPLTRLNVLAAGIRRFLAAKRSAAKITKDSSSGNGAAAASKDSSWQAAPGASSPEQSEELERLFPAGCSRASKRFRCKETPGKRLRRNKKVKAKDEEDDVSNYPTKKTTDETTVEEDHDGEAEEEVMKLLHSLEEIIEDDGSGYFYDNASPAYDPYKNSDSTNRDKKIRDCIRDVSLVELLDNLVSSSDEEDQGCGAEVLGEQHDSTSKKARQARGTLRMNRQRCKVLRLQRQTKAKLLEAALSVYKRELGNKSFLFPTIADLKEAGLLRKNWRGDMQLVRKRSEKEMEMLALVRKMTKMKGTGSRKKRGRNGKRAKVRTRNNLGVVGGGRGNGAASDEEEEGGTTSSNSSSDGNGQDFDEDCEDMFVDSEDEDLFSVDPSATPGAAGAAFKRNRRLSRLSSSSLHKRGRRKNKRRRVINPYSPVQGVPRHAGNVKRVKREAKKEADLLGEGWLYSLQEEKLGGVLQRDKVVDSTSCEGALLLSSAPAAAAAPAAAGRPQQQNGPRSSFMSSSKKAKQASASKMSGVDDGDTSDSEREDDVKDADHPGLEIPELQDDEEDQHEEEEDKMSFSLDGLEDQGTQGMKKRRNMQILQAKNKSGVGQHHGRHQERDNIFARIFLSVKDARGLGSSGVSSIEEYEKPGSRTTRSTSTTGARSLLRGEREGEISEGIMDAKARGDIDEEDLHDAEKHQVVESKKSTSRKNRAGTTPAKRLGVRTKAKAKHQKLNDSDNEENEEVDSEKEDELLSKQAPDLLSDMETAGGHPGDPSSKPSDQKRKARPSVQEHLLSSQQAATGLKKEKTLMEHDVAQKTTNGSKTAPTRPFDEAPQQPAFTSAASSEAEAAPAATEVAKAETQTGKMNRGGAVEPTPPPPGPSTAKKTSTSSAEITGRRNNNKTDVKMLLPAPPVRPAIKSRTLLQPSASRTIATGSQSVPLMPSSTSNSSRMLLQPAGGRNATSTASSGTSSRTAGIFAGNKTQPPPGVFASAAPSGRMPSSGRAPSSNSVMFSRAGPSTSSGRMPSGTTARGAGGPSGRMPSLPKTMPSGRMPTGTAKK